MKLGEYLEKRALECKNMAGLFLNDDKMYAFYMNAQLGFLIKLKNLSVQEAEKEYPIMDILYN